MPDARSDHTAQTSRLSPFLVAALVPALFSLFARTSGGVSLLPWWLETGLGIPAILAWGWFRCGLTARLPHRSEDRWLSIAVLAAGAVVAAIRSQPALVVSTTTLFISGTIFLEATLSVFARAAGLVEQPRLLLRRLGLPWAILILMATALLSIPLATQSAVPDYKHNFWSHILDSGFAAASSASLVGTSVYSFGEDYTSFGQGVIVVTSQLAGVGFCIVGLSVMRPFMRNRIRIASVLKLAFGLQLLAIVAMYSAWSEDDAPGMAQRLWMSIVYACDAAWNTGMIMRPDGLAPYHVGSQVFISISGLCIIGAIGIPIILDLMKPEPKSSRKGARQRLLPCRWLPQFEAGFALLLLFGGAVGIFLFEAPRLLPDSMIPSRPFDLGERQVPVRDVTAHGSRWTLAVFTSATLRSSGLQSIPVSQGALSWPSFALLLGWMTVGGSVGGVAGGLRTSSFLLIVICLFTRRAAWNIGRRGPATRSLILKCAVLWVFGWIALNLAGTLCLAMFSSGTAYELVFESTAALSGVGLSTGLSLHLTPLGQLVMITMIVAGRVIPAVFWLLLAEKIRGLDPDSWRSSTHSTA